jgi:hypothetical protein
MVVTSPAFFRHFDYLDLLLVDVRQHLGQVAHVEQRPAVRTVPKMICFSFCAVPSTSLPMMRFAASFLCTLR